MNKKFAVLTAGLLSVICLAGCAKECELSELTAQASKYDASEVASTYSSYTVKTEIYYESSSSAIQTVFSLMGLTSGEKSTSEDSYSNVAAAVVTSADLSGIADSIDVDSNYIHYYLDGEAIKVTVDYDGEVSYNAFSGEGSISYEMTTYSDGRYKKISQSIEFDTSSDDHFEYSTTATYSYTKA